MTPLEPDLPELDEILRKLSLETNEPIGPIDPKSIIGAPRDRLRPGPAWLQYLLDIHREDPNWSPEALEEVVTALRMLAARDFDIETAVQRFRAMAEPTLPKRQ